MSTEDLMKPRYKVIGTYPRHSSDGFELNDILTDDGFNAVRNQDDRAVIAIEWEMFPHLFKKLEWWEERAYDDLPQYLKPSERGKMFFDGVVKVMYYTGNRQDHFRYGEEKGECGHMLWTLPATEQEYLEYAHQ